MNRPLRQILTGHVPATMIAAIIAVLPVSASLAADGGWHFATALVGTPKYPADFTSFDYVNPDAPKGGLVRLSDTGTFDTLNFVVPKGTTPLGLGLIYDTLMSAALDEISTMYGLVAEKMSFPADYSSVTFKLRRQAKWHDGQPVTPADVVWSFEVLTANNPAQKKYYEHVTKAEVSGENEVTFTFDQANNRELPHIVGQLLILPKHWWTGKDGEGKARDVTRGSLKPPLGSGPYRVGKIIPGRTIAYERVPDYWGKDLPVRIGQNNFDEIRYEYFRDNTVEFEAFKADKVDFRNENQAKRWASEYNFPAMKRQQVVVEKFPERGRGVGVGWVYNLRRNIFSDIRVRRALNMAFNFEEANRTLFFGQYERIDSYHFGSELRSTGVPEGLELAILETVKDQVPAALFSEPYTTPKAETPQAHRANLRVAIGLLREAGYALEGSRMRHKQTGEPLKMEYLFLAGSSFERVGLRLQRDLEKIGVEVTLRPVDSAQYENRIRARDFDLVILGWGQSLSPGNEQLEYFGSKAADLDASRNFGGIKNPAVDTLIDRIIFAQDRDELIAATRALDRVLLWNEYILPTWTIRFDRTARWDRFGRPQTLPYYSEPAFPTIWWLDDDKAKAVEARK